MNDIDKLKRLAEWHCEVGGKIAYDAEEVAAPILALIAENERLKGVNAKRAATIADLVMERDEAVALLR